jgi:pantoate kinase
MEELKMTSQKIIDVLNNDPKACEIMKEFKEAAERQSLTEVEYNKAHEAILMMLISNNEEATNVMAKEAYSYASK